MQFSSSDDKNRATFKMFKICYLIIKLQKQENNNNNNKKHFKILSADFLMINIRMKLMFLQQQIC